MPNVYEGKFRKSKKLKVLSSLLGRRYQFKPKNNSTMKKKLKKRSGVKAPGSGLSAENNSDTGNSILISKDTDLDQLGIDLITVSNEDNTKQKLLKIKKCEDI
ncbi:MAG: hypothetical protein IPG09_03500 [Ignavibacteria bacterium]|nr:hypothetical protein [Ignavibacteria bacterium]